MRFGQRPLGEVCQFLSGGTPRMNAPRFWNGSVPWVSAKDMHEGRLYDSEIRVTESAIGNGTRLVSPGTTLCVVRGMSLAKEFRVAIARRSVTFNQDLKALVANECIVPEFLYYALVAMRNDIKDRAGDASHGTKKLETDVLRAIPIPMPDKEVQGRIVQVISAYDDLIENNRRRIQLLEEAARLLFREWFVRLRFPGREHVKISDGVPEGWTRTRVGEHVTLLNRGITPNYDDEASGLVINQKCVRDGRLDLSLARRQSKPVPEAKQVQKGDVLINSTGEGTLGRVAQVTLEIANCTVDSHVTIARPSDEAGLYYFGMSFKLLEGQISNLGRGATNQTELSRDSIGELRLLLPKSELLEEYEGQARVMETQVNVLSAENVRLREARDLLLPRLMSGELEP